MRDENLGIGANRGAKASHDQCTGLDVFQDVLGRLNGKDQTEIEADQRSRADLKRAVYAENRWGSLRFVSGGLLVGERIQKLVEVNCQQPSGPDDMLMQQQQVPAVLVSENEVTKTKVRINIEDSPSLPNAGKPKKARKNKRLNETAGLDFEENLFEGRKSDTTVTTNSGRNTPVRSGLRQSTLSKAQGHADKANRKLRRKIRREARKTFHAEQNGEPSYMPITPSLQQNILLAATKHPSGQKPEITNGQDMSSRDGIAGGRHAVRQRDIRHKKMAMMDTKALNEVWHCQTLLYLTWERTIFQLIRPLVDFDDKSIVFQNPKIYPGLLRSIRGHRPSYDRTWFYFHRLLPYLADQRRSAFTTHSPAIPINAAESPYQVTTDALASLALIILFVITICLSGTSLTLYVFTTLTTSQSQGVNQPLVPLLLLI